MRHVLVQTFINLGSVLLQIDIIYPSLPALVDFLLSQSKYAFFTLLAEFANSVISSGSQTYVPYPFCTMKLDIYTVSIRKDHEFVMAFNITLATKS